LDGTINAETALMLRIQNHTMIGRSEHILHDDIGTT